MRRILCIRFPSSLPHRPSQSEQPAPDWCRRYSPLVGWEDSDDSDSLLLDITGCAHLFGGEENMARQIVRELKRQGCAAGSPVAIADTIGAAWAVAHHAPVEREPVFVVPVGQQAKALARLPVGALRISSSIGEVLRDLGIETIGQLRELPRESLPSRFGPQILRRLDQAFGHLAEPVAPHRAVEPLEAKWGCEPPLEGGPAIEAVLRKLLGQLIRRLRARNEGIVQLQVELQVPKSEASSFDLGLVRPTLSRKRLIELAHLQWERLRLRGRVGGLTVRVTRTARLEVEQSTLLDNGNRRRDHRHLHSLLDRLSNRLGNEAVLCPKLSPDYEPERAVEYQALAGSPRSRDARPPSGSWLPQRPLRLFLEPVRVNVWSIMPDGPPVRLRWRYGEEEIVRCEGPERIETGWWRHSAVERDYFRAETKNGRRLWLFHSQNEGAWFVHGEF